ncbi:MAG: DUF3592 domain-containing protein [Bryobacteraceae bacterium]
MRIGRVGFLAIGALVIFGGLTLGAAKALGALTRSSAEGTVTQLGTSDTPLFAHWCVVEYVADGHRMEHRARTYLYSPCVAGERVKLLYDPNSPSNVEISTFDSEWFACIMIMLAGGVILLAGQWFYGWES